MKINEVESLVGITKRNIRFYEKEGLLTPNRNSENGYRDYTEDDITALRQVKLLRKLGVPLEEAHPQVVVLGFDTTITYNKLRLLCDAVRAGLPYIATHPDYNCPVAGGFIPDIGAVIAFVKASTGRDPDAVIGKPNAYIARAAAHKYGVSLEDVCMVGDRLYTDIALGACGCGTALVLCGETTPEALAAGSVTPGVVCADLAALGRLL